MAWYDLQDDFHRENDNWWKRMLKGLNNAFNPNHAWFDYDKLAEGSSVDRIFNALGTGLSNVVDAVVDPNVISGIINKYTGSHLTGAEQEANAFNAAEAQKSRDFTEYMARNKYSMETQSMQDAGVNPAMVYGGGNLVSTASNGAAASSVAPQSSDIANLIMSVVRMPLEMKKLNQEIAESESREKKNYIEAHGTDLQNRLTEETWSDIVEKAKLDNDDLSASIELKKQQAKSEEEKQRLTAAQTILTKMDKSQREEMFPLLMHAQELTNAYQETENRYQERRIRAELNEVSAKVKSLIASALLSTEQAKYAGRMTLGQVLGMALNSNGGLTDVVGSMAKQSPLGWLVSTLSDALSPEVSVGDIPGGAVGAGGR